MLILGCHRTVDGSLNGVFANKDKVVMKMTCVRWGHWALLLGGVLLFGCAGAQPHPAPVQEPGVVMHAYLSALKQHRWSDAYALLGARVRQHLTFEQFRRLVGESPAQVREFVEELERPSGSWRIESTLTSPSGRTVRMVKQGGVWRVDGESVFLYSQATPERALASFVRAFAAKRYDVLLRFVPSSKQRGLDADKLRQAWEGPDKQDIQQWVEQVKTALTSPKVHVLGDHATFSLGGDKNVELVREAANWKIQRFE